MDRIFLAAQGVHVPKTTYQNKSTILLEENDDRLAQK